MAGVHRPGERVGGGALPGPVLSVAPPRFPPFPRWHSVCIFVHRVHELLCICSALMGQQLQNVRETVHIMHESTDTVTPRGAWTPTPLPSTSSGRWSPGSS